MANRKKKSPNSSLPRILISAGPTHEPIDAVRYIANRSSGRMGVAIAEAAAKRGCAVTLLLGPSAVTPDSSQKKIEVIRFQTTDQLQRMLREYWPQHDMLIMAAAVADYRPAEAFPQSKFKRAETDLTLRLTSTPDLLAGLVDITRKDQFVVGFALQTEDNLLEAARDKLHRKSLDAIVANSAETMESETITPTVIFASGREIFPGKKLTKRDFAQWLLDELLSRVSPQRATTTESH